MNKIALALLGAATVAMPAVSHAQNPLSSIFQCNNANNNQRGGAVIGGLLGGVLGNQVAGDDDRTLGTILGAAAGAAAGSYLGCNMSSNDTGRAETATRTALDQNRSQTWTSASTGTSGRIDIVNTFYQNNVSTRVPTTNNGNYNNGNYNNGNYNNGNYNGGGYNQAPPSLQDITFARGVQFPSNYSITPSRYRADSRVNMRSGPDSRASVIGRVEAREQFDVLAKTNNGWLLVARGGQAVGYVSESVVRYQSAGNEYFENNDRYANGYGANGRNNNYGGGYNNNQPQQTTERQLCRTFDQTIQSRTSAPSTSRFTACQNSAGEWVINS